MPKDRPRSFEDVVAAQSETDKARWERSETFKDASAPAGLDDVTVIESGRHPGEWHVEYFGDDGECYVTVFAGPAAETRAREYFKALREGRVKIVREGPVAH